MEVFEVSRRITKRRTCCNSFSNNCSLTQAFILLGIILISLVALGIFHFLFRSHLNIKETFVEENTADFLISSVCEDDFCTTADCVKMATRISSVMNEKSDPCVDFYEYACGKYQNTLATKFGDSSDFENMVFSPVTETQLALLNKIRNMLDAQTTDAMSSAYQKMKQFYSSCMSTNKRNEEQLTSLNSWMADMELSLTDNSSDIFLNLESSGSWRIIISKLEEYGIHTVFKASFKGSSIPMEKIEIDCPLHMFEPNVYLGSSKENIYKLKIYKEAMDNILSLMSVDRPKRQEFVRDVLQMETNIATIIQNFNYSERAAISEIHTAQIKEIWRPIIGEAIQDSEVIDICPYNVEEIISTLNKESPRVSAHYVLWKMISQVLQYLTGDFRSLQNNYYSSVSFWQISMYEKDWQVCADVLRSDLGLIAFKALIDYNFIQLSELETIRKMFTTLKEDFFHVFNTISNIDRLSKRLFKNKLKTMKLNFGFSDLILEPLVLDTVYRDLEVSENYFLNVMNIKKFKTRYFFNRMWYGSSENPISEISLVQNPLEITTDYDYKTNTVQVGSSLFEFPLYFNSETLPGYLMFGETTLLSHVMSHAFDATGCFHDWTGKKWDKNFWPYPMREKYDYYLECLLNQTSTAEYWFSEMNNTYWMNTIMADISSFLIGYEGLSRYLKNETHDTVLPSLDLEQRQLFYVQVAQKFCQSSMDIYTLHFYKENNLSIRSRLNIAVSNTEDFADVFKCSSTSSLNIISKCNAAS